MFSLCKLGILMIVSCSLLTGCGRAAREAGEFVSKVMGNTAEQGAGKVGEVTNGAGLYDAAYAGPAGSSLVTTEWLNTYLPLKVPSTAVRELVRQRRYNGEYYVYPYRALYRGVSISDGEETPAFMAIEVQKECAWRLAIDMTFFLREEQLLVRADSFTSIVEEFEGQRASQRTHSRFALVSSYDAEKGEILEEERKQYEVTGIDNGLRVDFEEPEIRSEFVYGDFLLVMESDQYELDMMKQGVVAYSYQLLDVDAPQLHTKEEVTLIRYPSLPSFEGMDLWARFSTSKGLVGSEWLQTSNSTEIVNSLGVVIYMASSFMDTGDLELYLEEVEFIEPGACSTKQTWWPGSNK